MKQKISAEALQRLPGYRLHEYLLVITPPEELSDRILSLRQGFAEKFDAPSALRGRPQIVLAVFSQREMMEEKILSKLRTVAMSYPSFRVELKDFGSFPTHTLFINVGTKVAIQGLVKEIRSAGQRIMKADNDHKPYFITEPHLSIARNLKPLQYDQAWPEFRQKHFSARFVAYGMNILKKEEGGGPFRLLERMEFRNLPLRTRQGELF